MLIASKTADAVRISLIGEITDETPWSYSDAQVLTSVLSEAEGTKVELWVSSPGGNLDAAMAMRAQLESYQGAVEVHTAGIVASAATLLLCLPSARVIAHRGSVYMLHQARMLTEGDASALRKDADILDVCNDELIKIYQLRAKCDDERLRDMLAAETWLRPEEMQALGFIDEIVAQASDGFIAEPSNPEPVPDIPDALDKAVSARLAPRIEAIQTGLADISAKGETRAKAITDAAQAAVSGIAEASGKASERLTALGEDIGATLSKELKALRDEMAECKRSYEAQAKKYAALDATISRVYALAGGDLGCNVHDEQLVEARSFKLNV